MLGPILLATGASIIASLYLIDRRFDRIAWRQRVFMRTDLFGNPNYRWPDLWDVESLWGWSRGDWAAVAGWAAFFLLEFGVWTLCS